MKKRVLEGYFKVYTKPSLLLSEQSVFHQPFLVDYVFKLLMTLVALHWTSKIFWGEGEGEDRGWNCA